MVRIESLQQLATVDDCSTLTHIGVLEEIWQSAGCAKVEAIWEKPTRKKGKTKAMFRARWFLQVRVDQLCVARYNLLPLPK